MKIQTNENGEITAYTIVGSVENGEIFTGDLPNGFYHDFRPGYYKLVAGSIVVNQGYQDPGVSVPTGPSAEMQAINALGLVVAKMQAKETTSNV